MRVFDHSARSTARAGFSLARYYSGQRKPWLVHDQARGIEYPEAGGDDLTGVFDINADAATYVGLIAPFNVPEIGAFLLIAVRSDETPTTDLLLSPDGGSTQAPGDGLVPGETDLWSVYDA